MFMCRWFGINVNRIEKIQGSGKRCDYKFPFNNEVVVFESKGRSDKSKINNARADCILKKSNYNANLMYGIISYLPRDGSDVMLNIFDPPVNNDPLSFDEKYLIAKHYSRITELSGLTLLAKAIQERLSLYERNGQWDTSQLPISNVAKIGMSIQYGNNTFWTRKSLKEFNCDSQKYYVQFGLHNRVIDLLNSWDIDELSKFKLEDAVIEDYNISLLSDGSLFYLGNRRLE